MEYVYHGSSNQDIKELIPHKSTHGTYVYATSERAIATIMAQRCGDDATFTLSGFGNGIYDLVERIPDAFDVMFNNSFSIYTLDASLFKNINTGFSEVVSEEVVPVIKEEKYDSVMHAINKLAEEGVVNIYYYPARPDYIPSDDSDIIERLRNQENKINKPLTVNDICRNIFLHPNIEDELRELAEEKGLVIPSYEEIKEVAIKRQEERADKEFYIDNALKMYDINKLRTR